VVIRFLRLSLIAGFALLATGPALAQVKEWPSHLEILGGQNASQGLDAAGVFGVRLGGMIRDPLGADVTASFLKADVSENCSMFGAADPECRRVKEEVHRWAVDASVVRYRKKPETNAWFAVLGGVGFASTRIERAIDLSEFLNQGVITEDDCAFLVGSRTCTAGEVQTDNSVSFHAGIAAKWFFGKRYYVRPDIRARMVADGEYRRGWEGSIALGFVLRQQK
jgi:opacity protein-like surface antigen